MPHRRLRADGRVLATANWRRALRSARLSVPTASGNTPRALRPAGRRLGLRRARGRGAGLNAAITAHDAQQEWDYVGQIFNRASTVEATAVAAVRLILTLVNRNADSFERLQDFDGRVIQKADQSPVRKLEHLIAEFGERPIQKFIAHFMDRHIVMRHHEVAIRKMRGRSQSTQKFSFESGWVRYLRPMEAAFMGPRLPSLQHFLADLGLTQTDGVPTALASEWMDKHLVT